MVLSTVGADGSPSSRTVLLKGLNDANSPDVGLEFVTNYLSQKGRALAAHDRVSMLFPWYGLKRQVIVSGRAQRTDANTSDAFFDRRPHGARLAAIASDQSEPVDSRDTLDERMAVLEDQYPEGEHIPRPEKWGAFRVVPDRFEFWAGRSKRFHDRIVFTRDGAAHAYYQYSNWSERPARRIVSLAEARLAQGGGFRSVAQTVAGVRGDQVLSLRLDELIHDDSVSPGMLRLAVTAELLDWRTRTIAARRTFSRSTRVGSQDAKGAARAASVAVTELLDELVTWTEASAAAIPIRESSR
jgi:pyridoxamine 5'-phosphate oxidase